VAVWAEGVAVSQQAVLTKPVLTQWRTAPCDRHPPRRRGIQYAAASRLNHQRLWDTGSPAFAGDDSGGCGALGFNLQTSIANAASRPRGAMRPSFASIAALEKQEGAGKAGCALHPRSRVQLLLGKNAHEHTGSAEAIRPSLRNGFTAYFALSPVSRALLPPSLRRSLRKA
jgi:hypothetical protein